MKHYTYTKFMFNPFANKPLGLLSMLVLAAFQMSGAAPAKKPNIVLVVVDDVHVTQVETGIEKLTSYPAPLSLTKTPALHKLAETGITFANGYSANPMCWPSRGSIITGMYPSRWGDGTKIPLEYKWVPEHLKSAGYASTSLGKWHLRFDDKSVDVFKPLGRGFDEFFGFLAGAHSYYMLLDDSTKVGRKQGPIFKGHDPATVDDLIRTKPPYNEVYLGNPEDPEKTPWYLTEELTAQALDFIDRKHEEPFLVHLAYNARHTPGEVPTTVSKHFEGKGGIAQVTQASMIYVVDLGIQAIVEKLEDLGIRDNTIILFVGDNGGSAAANRNGDPDQAFRGAKGSSYEGGKRVPFIINWPAGLPQKDGQQRVFEDPIMHIDIVPTLLAAAGVSPVETLDGVDLLPYLRGEKTTPPHEILFWNNNARMGKWKFLRGWEDNALYDLSKDPLEQNNLADQYPEVAEEMSNRILQFQADTGWDPRANKKPKNEDDEE